MILNYSQGFDDTMKIFAVLGVLFAVNQAEGIITTLQILKFIKFNLKRKGGNDIKYTEKYRLFETLVDLILGQESLKEVFDVPFNAM